ncbi:hypothetical protein B0J13DRAFT_517967 [Dactylonectria estremocensis]|uniref:Uncharacterized protein n=1 Tax=Dactylonectria estremocensis TaxID=1079267 RepID=A0A9P9FIA0_9HYPO|nr:hypothetical protein B0J13DRAFT_517967 [Dactylonectria estremocensis]
MKKPWKPTPTAGGNAQPRAGMHPIRGRISGPVPISSSMDDEFPIRNPGSNVATPVRDDFKDTQPEPTWSGRDLQQAAPPTAPSPLNELHSNSIDISTPQPPVTTTRGPPVRMANTSHLVRHSIVSADAVQIKDKDRPHRKQSKLRGALGKLLGRRRKANPNDSPNNTDSDVGPAPTTQPNHHRSLTDKASPQADPNPAERLDSSRARDRPFPGAESKRSASLPITEFDRALRSHSVRPEDVRAIESARNSLSAEFGLSQKMNPRRSKETDLTGLSPRPASSQGRDSRTAQRDDDPAEIGRAITSDFTGSRRRSRSLSGLPEVDEDQSKARRRSDEIRYWRESYDPGFMSPVSSDAPEVEDIAPMGAEATDKDPLKAPPEPFHFGTFPTMREIGGMKITQAANLEIRVSNLEARVYRLEQVLNQVCHDLPEFPSQTDPPYRSAPPIPIEEASFEYTISRPLTSPASQTRINGVRDSFRSGSHKRSDSAGSFDEAAAFHTILDSDTLPTPNMPGRPTSTTTIRGVSSLPTLSKDSTGPFTMDHYATLLALVHTERSAREVLESQVKSLGYQVSVLAKSTVPRRDTRYDPPPTAKSFGDRSAFDHDDDENEPELAMVIDTQARSIDPEDSGIGTAHGDESEYSETYETPREEGYGFGAFGEDLEEEHLSQKKSARTLSLSQLTQAKKIPSSRLPPHAI